MIAARPSAPSSIWDRWRRFAAVPLALCGALALPGCYGAYGVEADYPVAPGDVAYDVAGYPSYDYGGTTVYLVGDRWYYPSGGAWYAFGAEPPVLFQYRASLGGYYGGGYRGYRGYGGYGGYRGAYPAYHGGVYRGGPVYHGGYRGGPVYHGGYRGGPVYHGAPAYHGAAPVYHGGGGSHGAPAHGGGGAHHR